MSNLPIAKINHIKKLKQEGNNLFKIRQLTGHNHGTIIKALAYNTETEQLKKNTLQYDYYNRILPFDVYIDNEVAFNEDFLAIMPVFKDF